VPPADETALLLAKVVGHIARDHSITRVPQVAALAQMSVRNLQRAFADYVGAGPKWVIQRCRLQDAAARAAAAESVDWSQSCRRTGIC
jgi:transcriptional regulator GlxA family with amidase domain